MTADIDAMRVRLRAVELSVGRAVTEARERLDDMAAMLEMRDTGAETGKRLRGLCLAALVREGGVASPHVLRSYVHRDPATILAVMQGLEDQAVVARTGTGPGDCQWTLRTGVRP